MNLSELQETVGHRRCANTGPCEARDHGGEIISSIEAIFELCEVSRHVFGVDGAVSSGDCRLDVAEGGVDPLECRRASGVGSAPCGGHLMRAAGVGHAVETAQAVAEHDAVCCQAGCREGRDRSTAKT